MKPGRFLLALLLSATASSARADVMYYALEDVVLSDGRRMTGFFSWTYQAGDFENGSGQFFELDIPWTHHNQDDLDTAFDLGSSIEITLEGSVHDDGVDITLFLAEALTPTTPAALDLARSKYEIGGNGFHDGPFLGGRIVPVPLTLHIAATGPGPVTIWWEPDVPGVVLRATADLRSPHWTVAGGGTNPAEISAPGPAQFYRLERP
jgi:hypothetical protein